MLERRADRDADGGEWLRKGESRAALIAKVAREFAALAQELERAGHDPLAAAHFVNRLVFCMFAEDVGLLGEHLFTRMLEAAKRQPDRFVEYARRISDAALLAELLRLHLSRAAVQP